MKGMKKMVTVLVVLGMVVVFAAPASAKWYAVDVVYTTTTDTVSGAVVQVKVERDD